MAVAQPFIHIETSHYSILHITICELLCWPFLLQDVLSSFGMHDNFIYMYICIYIYIYIYIYLVSGSSLKIVSLFILFLSVGTFTVLRYARHIYVKQLPYDHA